MDVIFLFSGFWTENGNFHPKTVTLYHLKIIFWKNGNFIPDKRQLSDEKRQLSTKTSTLYQKRQLSIKNGNFLNSNGHFLPKTVTLYLFNFWFYYNGNFIPKTVSLCFEINGNFLRNGNFMMNNGNFIPETVTLYQKR